MAKKSGAKAPTVVAQPEAETPVDMQPKVEKATTPPALGALVLNMTDGKQVKLDFEHDHSFSRVSFHMTLEALQDLTSLLNASGILAKLA